MSDLITNTLYRKRNSSDVVRIVSIRDGNVYFYTELLSKKKIENITFGDIQVKTETVVDFCIRYKPLIESIHLNMEIYRKWVRVPHVKNVLKLTRIYNLGENPTGVFWSKRYNRTFRYQLNDLFAGHDIVGNQLVIGRLYAIGADVMELDAIVDDGNSGIFSNDDGAGRAIDLFGDDADMIQAYQDRIGVCEAKERLESFLHQGCPVFITPDEYKKIQSIDSYYSHPHGYLRADDVCEQIKDANMTIPVPDFSFYPDGIDGYLHDTDPLRVYDTTTIKGLEDCTKLREYIAGSVIIFVGRKSDLPENIWSFVEHIEIYGE